MYALKNKAISATFWSGVDSLARLGMQFSITLILARLLTPADYGTVGLLAVFMGLAATFIDAGFSSALIQRKEITDTDLSSVFYFNIVMALLMAGGLCLVSPWIATFYKASVLKPLTWLLAANLVIGSFGTVQRMLLTKALQFRRQCFIASISTAGSGAVAILLALKGFGVWSLGIQYCIASVFDVFLVWMVVEWRPRVVFSPASIHKLFNFSGFILLSNLSNAVFARINLLFIGRMYSSADLGFYSRADGLRLLPGELLAGIIDRVAFPLFSASHEDKDLLRAGLRKAITFVMLLNMPIMIGMLVTAEMLVRVLFGTQWLPCVPYVRILCLNGLFWPLHILNLSVLKAMGKTNLFFRLEVIKKTIGIIFLVSACPFGIVAIAWSSAFSSFVCFVINAHYSGRFLQYGMWWQIRDLLPCSAGVLVMAIFVWPMSRLPIGSPIWLLVIQLVSAVAVYAIYCSLIKVPAFIDAVAIMKGRLPWTRR